MSVPTKASSFLLGSSYSAPATVTFGGGAVVSMADTIFFGCCFKWWVIYPGSPGTVPVTVQPQVSDDNSHWTNDGGAFVAPIPAGGGTVTGTYLPPQDEVYARLQFVNADTGVSVTAVANATNTTVIS